MRLYMTELAVSDVSHASAWWSTLLKRLPVFRDDANGFVLFEVAGGRVAIKRSAAPGGGTVHFEVDDLPDGDVKESSEGYRRVKLTDPDGNVVVFFKWVR